MKAPPSGAVLLAGLLTGCNPEAETSSEQQTAVQAPSAVTSSWPPPKVARTFDPAQIARGKTLYDRHCATCHGPEGKGPPGDWRQRGPDGRYPPPPLDDSAHAWHHPTKILHQAIGQGIPDTNMPAWGGKLTDAQIADLVVYIKSLWSDEVYAVWYDIERRSLEN
jgi:mono/diheme cytochrome c family protein